MKIQASIEKICGDRVDKMFTQQARGVAIRLLTQISACRNMMMSRIFLTVLGIVLVAMPLKSRATSSESSVDDDIGNPVLMMHVGDVNCDDFFAKHQKEWTDCQSDPTNPEKFVIPPTPAPTLGWSEQYDKEVYLRKR